MAIPKEKENHSLGKSTKHVASVKKYVLCPYSHEPNEETKQAMRDVDDGIGLKTYNSVDELWKALVK